MIRALRQKKTRQETGNFLVEGIHLVGEAAQAGMEIGSILYAPELLRSDFALGLIDELAEVGVPCYPTDADVFKSAAGKENPQGLMAVVSQFDRKLTELTPQNFNWGAALISPQDPGNIGTILRTIDAVGADGLVLIDESADPYHPSCVRASMGSMFWLSITSTSFSDFSYWVADMGYTVYGSSAHGDSEYTEIDNYRSPCVLLMGSERAGMSPQHEKICETVLRIPLRGRASSLNLGVAAGVLLFSMMAKQS